MDRKAFFQVSFKKASSWLQKTCSFHVTEKAVLSLENSLKKQERPPGALSDENTFLRTCTGCDACMAACPINVIMIDDLEKRYPIIYPEEAPCIHCEGYPCIAACPTGALKHSDTHK